MLRGTFKVVLAIGTAVFAMHSVNASALTRSIYTVKFVCGTQAPQANLNAPAEPPVKPGNYATVINIEALSEGAKGEVLVSLAGAPKAFPGGGFGINQFTTTDITCADIAKAIGTPAPAFITGFVDIAFAGAIKVTAVYTSQGCNFLGTRSLGCSGHTGIDVVPQDPVPLGPSGIGAAE